jgi:hypothetical protein
MPFSLRSLTQRWFSRRFLPAQRQPWDGLPIRLTRRRSVVRIGLEQLEDRWLPSVSINVDAGANQHTINPNVYGVTFAGSTGLTDLNATLNRSGGTPTSTYNWQANASNRGNDYYFESISDGSATPGTLVDNFVSTTKAGHAEPIVTVPTLDWVAKLGPGRSSLASFSQAKYGPQTDSDPNWPDAGNGILAATGKFVTGNDPNDAYVPSDTAFQQNWINHLIGQFGTAGNGGVRYYGLDNEPGIWHESHRDVHPNGATMDEVRDKIIAYAAMIRAADPSTQILGPEEWNYEGYLISGSDLKYDQEHGYKGVYPDRLAHGNQPYIPYVLDQIRQHDAATGTRLLDYLSVHYYPQGDDAGHQEFSADVSLATQLLRNRSTRSLWDPNYTDISYVNDKIQLIPRLRNWVNTYYPGTKIALTEYNWGAENHMNGATSEADVLGIFGREGLDMAVRWEAPAAGTPTYNAIKMYRNYDGNSSTFGDTSVLTTAPNPDEVSAFGAVRSVDGALTVMVVDKNLVAQAPPGTTDDITVNLSDFADNGVVQFYLLSAPNPNDLSTSTITHLADGTVSGNSFTVSIPRQSVLLAIVPPSGGNQPPGGGGSPSHDKPPRDKPPQDKPPANKPPQDKPPSAAGLLQFSNPGFVGYKNSGTATVTITRTSGSTGTVAVAYATSDGSAVAGRNYATTSGTLTFAPGETSKSFNISIFANDLVEGNMTVRVTLSNVTGGAQLVGPSTTVLTIIDTNMPQVADTARPANLTQAADAFAHSREHYTQFITAAYGKYLGRSPDEMGLNAWLTLMMDRKVTDEGLESGFLGSPEYIRKHGGPGRGWVAGMYQDLLSRTPAQTEIDTWMKVLANGTSEAQVAYGFTASAERETMRVREDYRTYLARRASDAEVSLWVNAFLGGVTNEDVVSGFVGSLEYYDGPQTGQGRRALWLTCVYKEVLLRAPTVGELNGWLAVLQ